MKENIHYPETLGNEDIVEGQTTIQFDITDDGKMEHINIVQSSGNERYDKEAMRVVESMTKIVKL